VVREPAGDECQTGWGERGELPGFVEFSKEDGHEKESWQTDCGVARERRCIFPSHGRHKPPGDEYSRSEKEVLRGVMPPECEVFPEAVIEERPGGNQRDDQVPDAAPEGQLSDGKETKEPWPHASPSVSNGAGNDEEDVFVIEGGGRENKQIDQEPTVVQEKEAGGPEADDGNVIKGPISDGRTDHEGK